MLDKVSFKSVLVSGTAFAALSCAFAAPASAQANQPDPAPLPAAPATDAQEPEGNGNNVFVTGSRLRQDPNNSALPLQIITNQEIQRNSISSPEQLLMFLPSNASGADNLA